jgi:AcrR family transcriptional regulator
MYHYFPDKHELVQAVIDYQADAIVNRNRHALGSANGVEAWRNMMITAAKRTQAKGGCQLGSLVGQLAESDPEARALIAAGFDQWAAAIGDALRSLHTEGKLPSGIDPDDLAVTLLATLQGGLLLAQVHGSSLPFETAINTLLALMIGSRAALATVRSRYESFLNLRQSRSLVTTANQRPRPCSRGRGFCFRLDLGVTRSSPLAKASGKVAVLLFVCGCTKRGHGMPESRRVADALPMIVDEAREVTSHSPDPNNGATEVLIPLARLRPGPQVRFGGVDEAHARVLAAVPTSLPPIIVHASTFAVIDGSHRVRAAQIRGALEISAVLVDGSAVDLYMAAVRANVGHGKPLSIEERQVAAARLLESHAELSDRSIGDVCGLSHTTIGKLRRATGQNGQLTRRLGRDGRLRSPRLERAQQLHPSGRATNVRSPEDGSGDRVLEVVEDEARLTGSP